MNLLDPVDESSAVDSILAECLDRSAKPSDAEVAALAAAHPEHADELSRFFVDTRTFQSRIAPVAALPTAGHWGDFDILGLIGAGGMGEVYRARRTGSEAVVALKVMQRQHLADPELAVRFAREIQAAMQAQATHPLLVPVYEAGTTDGQPWFTMQYIEGETLAALARPSGLAPHAAARYVGQTAEAVQALHDRGILHRDLKPANVLVDAFDQPHVTDFGLALLSGEGRITMSGRPFGTYLYMSPEQAAGRRSQIAAGSDVYGLGAILYELLTGQPPTYLLPDADTAPPTAPTRRSITPARVLQGILCGRLVPPRELRRDVPEELEAIALRCLAREPSERFATAHDVAAALRDWSSTAASPVDPELSAARTDETARGELLEKFRIDLQAMAGCRLPDHLRARLGASDVVQETMLAAFRQFDQFRGATLPEFGGWLRTIHRRHIVHAARKKSGQEQALPTSPDDSSPLDFPDDRSSPSVGCLRRETRELIQAWLAHLTPQRREVVELHHLQGLSLKEVAARIATTQQIVTGRLRHAMSDLRQLAGQPSS